MAMGLGSRLPGAMLRAVIAIMVLSFTGCQHASTSSTGTLTETWHVLERIGEVQLVGNGGSEGTLLRPGETITADRLLTTGNGAHLILARDGVQLTADENTALKLPAGVGTSSIVLEKGLVRLRLATAANQTAHIKTADFDINSAHATLILRTDEDGTDLAVETGSITLAAANGRHHATLIAGAAAKIDRTSGGDLLIRPALGKAFAKVVPRPEKVQTPSSNNKPPTPREVKARAVAPKPRPQPPDTADAAASTETAVIRPASRLKLQSHPEPRSHSNKADAPLPEPPNPIKTVDLPPKLTISPPSPATSPSPAEHPLPKRVKSPSPARRGLAPLMFAGADDRQSANPVNRPAATSDPLQLRFDRLTEGLVDGL